MFSKKRFLYLACASVIAGSLVACSPAAPNAETFEPDSQQAKIGEAADGPHAAEHRKLAPVKVSENAAGTVSIIEADFGNTTAGDFSAPARGILVAPKESSGPSPVIVLSHLRAPNCSEQTFAFPCPAGTEEYRFDRGMTYFATELAENGYTVVIPDLGGIFIGADLTEPYSQEKMWQDVVGKFISALEKNAAGNTNIFKVPNLPTPDLTKVGLFVHSRSGQIVNAAVELFGVENLRGVFAYGPAYDTFDIAEITPPPVDIPYFAVTGESDADVGSSANLWIGHHLLEKRKSAALVASVPGLGHMLINDEAAKHKLDDRLSCDVQDCPDEHVHQLLIKQVGLDWFNALLKQDKTSLPLGTSASFPDSLAHLPARWLAVTPAPLASLAPEAFKAVSEGTARVCVHADPMNPVQPENACPMPEQGVVQVLTEVNYLTDAAADTEVKGAKGIALHVSPSGTYADAGTELEVILTLGDGREESLRISDQHPALVNRLSKFDNGVYQLGTVRLPLPESLRDATITKVRVVSPKHPIELRSVDFY